MPVSPLCDRNNHNLSKSQVGFIKFVVRPCFEPLSEFCNVRSSALCGLGMAWLEVAPACSPTHTHTHTLTTHHRSHCGCEPWPRMQSDGATTVPRTAQTLSSQPPPVAAQHMPLHSLQTQPRQRQQQQRHHRHSHYQVRGQMKRRAVSLAWPLLCFPTNESSFFKQYCDAN